MREARQRGIAYILLLFLFSIKRYYALFDVSYQKKYYNVFLKKYILAIIPFSSLHLAISIQFTNAKSKLDSKIRNKKKPRTD